MRNLDTSPIVPLALTLALSLLLAPVGGCEPPLRKGKTNVVLVIVDTLRADHLGTYGYDKPTSANLDALAAEGLVFEHTIANCSWTRPSIASLLTGVYPRTTGVYKEKYDALSPEVVTLAERFQAAGYATYGMTANPSINSSFGFDQGFDQYADCGVVWPWMEAEEGQEKYKRGRVRLDDARTITDRALEVLEQHEGGPFYLQTLYIDPHAPYRAPRDFEHELNVHPRGMVENYDAEIAYVDHELGRLLDHLRSEYPNTLIIVTSDHGEGLRDHRGLRMSKTHGYHLYDSVLHVPLIFHHPRIEPARFEGTVQLLDLVPTVADLMRLELAEPLAGTSLERVVRGKRPPPLPTQVFSESQFKEVDKISVREDDVKLVINRDWESLQAGINADVLSRKGRKRVREAIEAGGPRELYALPGEENPTAEGLNLAGDEAEAERVARLEQALLEWDEQTLARPPINRDHNREVDDTMIRQLRALGYLDGDPEAPGGEPEEETDDDSARDDGEEDEDDDSAPRGTSVDED